MKKRSSRRLQAMSSPAEGETAGTSVTENENPEADNSKSGITIEQTDTTEVDEVTEDAATEQPETENEELELNDADNGDHDSSGVNEMIEEEQAVDEIEAQEEINSKELNPIDENSVDKMEEVLPSESTAEEKKTAEEETTETSITENENLEEGDNVSSGVNEMVEEEQAPDEIEHQHEINSEELNTVNENSVDNMEEGLPSESTAEEKKTDLETKKSTYKVSNCFMIYPVTISDLESSSFKFLLTKTSTHRFIFPVGRSKASLKGVLSLRIGRGFDFRKAHEIVSDLKLRDGSKPQVLPSLSLKNKIDRAMEETFLKSYSSGDSQPASVFVNNIPIDAKLQMLNVLFPSATGIQMPTIADGVNMGYAIVELSSLAEARDLVKRNTRYSMTIGSNELNFYVIGDEGMEEESTEEETIKEKHGRSESRRKHDETRKKSSNEPKSKKTDRTDRKRKTSREKDKPSEKASGKQKDKQSDNTDTKKGKSDDPAEQKDQQTEAKKPEGMDSSAENKDSPNLSANGKLEKADDVKTETKAATESTKNAKDNKQSTSKSTHRDQSTRKSQDGHRSTSKSASQNRSPRKSRDNSRSTSKSASRNQTSRRYRNVSPRYQPRSHRNVSPLFQPRRPRNDRRSMSRSVSPLYNPRRPRNDRRSRSASRNYSSRTSRNDRRSRSRDRSWRRSRDSSRNRSPDAMGLQSGGLSTLGLLDPLISEQILRASLLNSGLTGNLLGGGLSALGLSSPMLSGSQGLMGGNLLSTVGLANPMLSGLNTKGRDYQDRRDRYSEEMDGRDPLYSTERRGVGSRAREPRDRDPRDRDPRNPRARDPLDFRARESRVERHINPLGMDVAGDQMRSGELPPHEKDRGRRHNSVGSDHIDEKNTRSILIVNPPDVHLTDLRTFLNAEIKRRNLCRRDTVPVSWLNKNDDGQISLTLRDPLPTQSLLRLFDGLMYKCEPLNVKIKTESGIAHYSNLKDSSSNEVEPVSGLCKVFVGNMSPNFSEHDEEELVGLFNKELAKRGVCEPYEKPIKSISTDQGRPFQFMKCASPAFAHAAIIHLNDFVYMNKNLTLRSPKGQN